VPSTLIGQVNQILSQMNGVKTQNEFICACLRGVTSNHLSDKTVIINKIFEAFKEKNLFSIKDSTLLYAEGRIFKTFSNLPS
jgi:hypothetical protein